MAKLLFTVEYLIRSHGPNGVWYRSDTHDCAAMANARRSSLLHTMREYGTSAAETDVRVRRITGKAPACVPADPV